MALIVPSLLDGLSLYLWSLYLCRPSVSVPWQRCQFHLQQNAQAYAKSAPQLATWAEANLPEGFTVFSFPEAARKRLRTSNMCETLNSQIKRRTRVVGLFPGESSLLRLVTAVLIEISEEWETGKVYLKPQPTEPTR